MTGSIRPWVNSKVYVALVAAKGKVGIMLRNESEVRGEDLKSREDQWKKR